MIQTVKPEAIEKFESVSTATLASGIVYSRLTVRGDAGSIADEAKEMTAYEDFITEKVRGSATTRGLTPPTDASNLDLFAECVRRAGARR